MSNKLVDLVNQYTHDHTISKGGKTLQIKPITTGQMKAILQYEGNDDPEIVDNILDDIITGCVVSGNFSVDELTLQDRFDLLIGIRKISKGVKYTFNIKCPKCGLESIQSINLDDLTVKPYKEPTDNIVVINDNLSVSFRHITRADQKQAVALVNKMGKLSDIQRTSEIATYLYALGMVEFTTKQGVLGNITIDDKKEFLDSLGSKSYDTINGWYEDNDYGTNFVYNVKCKNTECGFTKEEDIPMTGFFF